MLAPGLPTCSPALNSLALPTPRHTDIVRQHLWYPPNLPRIRGASEGRWKETAIDTRPESGFIS
jgi:hypothetical protein